MSVAVREFERRDRDQLTALVNLHVAAVIPGVVLSVNAVLSQLEREPDEAILDPWVARRCCLVAERDAEIIAAALLHRFRADQDVQPEYRNAGEIRWLVCKVDAVDAGEKLLRDALARMASWRVTWVGADCALPVLGCYGIPDTLAHIRDLLTGAGFADPTCTEVVLVARCDELVGRARDGVSAVRTLGLLGARLALRRNDHELGFIEVCDQSSAMARSSVAVRWADIGNLVIHDERDRTATKSMLLSTAADWLLLGGITRLVHYWAKDVDTPKDLSELERLGFRQLVTNERGMRRPA